MTAAWTVITRRIRGEPLLSLLLVALAVLALLDHTMLTRIIAYASVPTLAAIFCFLVASRILEDSGVFAEMINRLFSYSGNSPRLSLVLLVLAAATLAAVIMNDASMFFVVPMAVALARAAGIDRSKAVVAVSMAANIGSSLTPIGNPQNIYIWMRWRPTFLAFMAGMAPFVALWMAILAVYIAVTTPSVEAQLGAPPRVLVNKKMAATGVAGLLADIVLVEEGLWLVALAVSLAAALVSKRLLGSDVLAGVDYALIATLALMFIVFNEVACMVAIPPISSPLLLILAGAGLSQVISNVPATIVLARSSREWLPLAIGVNLGGIGTVVGSLANFIGVRLSGVSVGEFHRYAVKLFLAALVATIALEVLLVGLW